ncbi:hypothetical protein [Streptomyces sp. NPDC019507]|uniref:hypothetical protein n=1 Tax=Streptomyces sp. NPDC019507 TaxID=3154689 RepID=UPI0033E94257
MHQRKVVYRRCRRSSALAVGIVGGVCGIGGGSILGPVLVGRGVPVTDVAPAAPASTFATSVVGASTYALLSLTQAGSMAPDWFLETFLRLLLGTLTAAMGALYAVDALG